MSRQTQTDIPSSRDKHLFGPGPKRILALDGGGVRGAVTLAFLERIERVLMHRFGPGVRLGDHFDLIGGTSTGSIIACALALGKTTAEIRKFYFDLAPLVFKHRRWAIPILQAKFDVGQLRRQIEQVVGRRTLDSTDLMTGLAIVSKRVDTGSPWIVSNNPRSPYWEDGLDHIGNRHYSLANLVRASTAAPHFFDPEMLAISRDESVSESRSKPLARPFLARALEKVLELIGWRKPFVMDPTRYGLFIDGGVTPYGTPALALLHLATLRAFGLCWPAEVDRLTVTSIGTGSYRPKISYESLGFARFPKLAYHALLSIMSDAEVLTLTMMQWMGSCKRPWVINSEIGTLSEDAPPCGKIFGFQRYNLILEKEWLAEQLGRQFSDSDVMRLRSMDDASTVPLLYELASQAAEQQVDPADW